MEAELVTLAWRDGALSVPGAIKKAKMIGNESRSGLKSMRFQFPAAKRGIQDKSNGKIEPGGGSDDARACIVVRRPAFPA